MLERFRDVCCARFPTASLAALAELRAVPGVVVRIEGVDCWVRWDAESERVLRVLAPLPSVRLFERRDRGWHAFGARLPADGVPETGFRPLYEALVPAPLQPLAPDSAAPPKTRLRLRPDDRARQTTAMLAPASELLCWIDTVPTARFGHLRAALCEDHALAVGARLPLLAGSARFWGEGLLLPLGMRVEPHLPESALRAVFLVAGQDLVLFREDSIQIVPAEALRPLTRAGLRRAVQEAPHDA